MADDAFTLNEDAAAKKIPTLAVTEIKLGRMLGQGGFSIVCKIENIDLNDVFDTGEEESQARSDFAASLRESQYVMKTLRTDLPEEEYTKGIVDLAIEAEFLAVLSHPNIISMRAMANSDPLESKFFVVLDRLVTTLDRKFNFWRKEVGDNIGIWFGPFGYCCSKEQNLYKIWLERMTTARDIANALYYLHCKNIVYRDLKPDNLGFDAHGTLKLFDFGLAKRLQPDDRDQNGMYLLTGNTGSLRYMAPEVAQGETYNQKVDTYSFGILFWQICSLQTPYAGFTTKMHAERVVRQGHRPRPDPSWPLSWNSMMNNCWTPVTKDRPDFDEIAVFLEDQVDDLMNSDGEVPSRLTEIKAKARKKQAVGGDHKRLDVDTRIATKSDGPGVKRFDKDVI